MSKIEWEASNGFTLLRIDNVSRGAFDHHKAGETMSGWGIGDGSEGFGLDFDTETQAAMHVVTSAWKAGHIVGAPTLSDGTVLAIDPASLRAELAKVEQQAASLRAALEVFGGE